MVVVQEQGNVNKFCKGGANSRLQQLRVGYPTAADMLQILSAPANLH